MDAHDRKSLMDSFEKILAQVKRDQIISMTKLGLEPAQPLQTPKTAPPVSSPTADKYAVPVAKSIEVEEAFLERHRILAHRARSHEADIFRILRTQVLQIMNKSGYRTLAITSPHYGDGKTTIALN